MLHNKILPTFHCVLLANLARVKSAIDAIQTGNSVNRMHHQNLPALTFFLGIHGYQQLLHLLVMERRCSSISRALVFSLHHPDPAIEQLHGAGLGLCWHRTAPDNGQLQGARSELP